MGQSQQDICFSAPGDHGRSARTCGPLGSQNFGDHPTLAKARSSATRHVLELGVAGARLVHKCGVRVAPWVGAVEAFLVGQDDQSIGIDQVGHQGTQGIVVAELDLVVDHRVVFVDDRQHAVLQQGQQR